MLTRVSNVSTQKVGVDFPTLHHVLADLDKLDRKASDRVLRAGLRVVLNTIGSEMKKRLDPTVKIAAKGVKSKIKGRGGRLIAKVGFGVGRKLADTPKLVRQDRPKNRPGVGISALNVHWWIQGTAERFRRVAGRPTVDPVTKRWVRAKGKTTGQMPAKQPGLATYAAVAAAKRAETKAIEVMRKRLNTELKKIGV